MSSFVTSWIPTTSAAVTRSQEQCSILPASMGFYVSPGGSWALEYICMKNNASASSTALIAQHNNVGGPIPMYLNTSAFVSQWDGGGILANNVAAIDGVVNKAATTRSSGGVGTECLNGGTVSSGSGLTTGYTLLGTNGIDFLRTSEANATQMKAGYVRRVRYWPRVLTNVEMQQVTT